MSRKAKELALRQRATIKVLPNRSWAPELAGMCLLIAAVLSSAGVLA
jgi:hypothetical protein